MSPAPSGPEALRIWTTLTLIFLALVVLALGLSVFAGSVSSWALLGVAVIGASFNGWRAIRERRVVRQIDPDSDLTGPELTKLAGGAAAAVLVVLVARAIAALLS